MKKIFEQFSAYNIWANQKMVDVILPLPKETTTKKVESSFPTLQLTLLHMWNADSIWYQRINLAETVQIPGQPENTIEEIAAGFMEQCRLWQVWISKSLPTAFEHEFIYRNLKQQQFKKPVYEVLLHLFNHATYHRGQLVTMLRQLAVTTLPATDFVLFAGVNNTIAAQKFAVQVSDTRLLNRGKKLVYKKASKNIIIEALVNCAYNL